MRISNAQPCARGWAAEQAGKGTRTRLTQGAGTIRCTDARKDRSHFWLGPRRRSQLGALQISRAPRATDHGGSSYAQAASQGQPSLLLEAQDSPTHDRVRGWEKRRRGRSDREERKPRARAHTRLQDAHARTRLAPIFWRKDMGGRSRPPPDPKSALLGRDGSE